jgi:4-amino-4-deoxy-L-arabinose transferase-like glycosyltransferase
LANEDARELPFRSPAPTMTDSSETATRTSTGRSRLLWVALICHLALATTHAFLTPAYEGLDENDHVYYASFLRATGELPIVKDSHELTGRSVWDEAVLAHHPPLYYALTSSILGDRLPSWRLNPDYGSGAPAANLHKLHGADELGPVSTEIRALQRARLLSVLCGLVSIWLTWLLARRVFPERPQVADAAALLLACVPQWSWMHGTVENGNLATTLGLAATLALLGAVQRRRVSIRRSIAIGVVVGCALITKLTSVYLLPLCALVWTLLLWRGSARGRTFGAGLVALIAIAGIAGWFFVRNHELYSDWLARSAHAAAFAGNRLADVAAATNRPLSEVRLEYLTSDFLVRSARSAVAAFGWRGMRIPFAEALALAVTLLAGAGWAIGARGLVRGRARELTVLAAAIALVAYGLFQFNWTFVQPQGRYLFPAYGPFLILVAAGLSALLERSPLRIRAAGIAILAGSVAIAAVAGIAVVATNLDARLAPAEDPRFASLIAGVTTPPTADRATIVTEAPLDGSTADTAPTFRWQDSGAPADSRYTIHVVLPSGLGLGTFESAGVTIADRSWRMPDAIWRSYPSGATIRWKVRRLPNRASGEGVDDVPESPFATVIRSR